MFQIDFGKIAEPGSEVGARSESELRLPVAVLRRLNSQAAGPETAGLIFRFTFDKPEGSFPPTEFDDDGPFRLGTGILRNGAKFSDPNTNIGAVEFDGTGY